MTDKKREGRVQALNAALRRMFSGLAGRPVPERLNAVVEQLDEDAAQDAPDQRKRVG